MSIEYLKFGHSEKATKISNNLPLDLTITKGQLVSRYLFGVFTFFQKTNKNKPASSKVEFVRSFFWKKRWLEKIISNLSDL